MQTLIDALLSDLVQRAHAGHVTKAELARQSRLHVNTFKHFGRDTWNPTMDTLRRIESVLPHRDQTMEVAIPPDQEKNA